jgi:glycerate dehydrogenase
MCQLAFGTEVKFWNRTLCPHIVERHGWEQTSVDDVMATCDVIVVTCSYRNPETHHLINADRIAMMKPDAILLTTSRASVIDPVPLREALANGSIGGVAMDNYYVQPLPKAEDDPHGLLEFFGKNLIVTPHMGFATDHGMDRTLEVALDNLSEIAETGKPLIPIPVRREEAAPAIPV